MHHFSSMGSTNSLMQLVRYSFLLCVCTICPVFVPNIRWCVLFPLFQTLPAAFYGWAPTLVVL
jgi:hypothetical protein